MFYMTFGTAPAGLFLEQSQGAALWHVSNQQSPLHDGALAARTCYLQL